MPNPKGKIARLTHVMSKQSWVKIKKKDMGTDKKIVGAKETE